MRTRVLAALLLLLVSAPAWADPSQDEVSATLRKIVRDQEVPGGVLLVTGRSFRLMAVYGVAEQGVNAPVREDSRFYIASTGKMMTAAAVLQWMGEAGVGLSEPAAGRLGNGPASQLPGLGGVTLGHLLSHTSGLPDYLSDAFETAADAQPARVWRPDDLYGFALAETAEEPLGTYDYSNTNFVLLGDILARADGASLAASLERRVFRPCGMTDISVGVPNPDARHAHGYEEDDDGIERDRSAWAWGSVTGDGPVTASAPAVERFLRCLLDERKLVPPNLLARMTEDGTGEEYGLGLEVRTVSGTRFLGHSGYYAGYTTEAWYAPDTGLAMVLMLNGDTYDAFDGLKQVYRRLLR